MSFGVATSIVSIVFSGLLAGEEVAIRFGVRGPLSQLPDAAHIEMRIALIRTLRVLVPSIFFVALASSIASAAANSAGATLRYSGAGLLVAFITLTLAGTVPLNKAVLTWSATSPPPNWRATIRTWERLDSLRTLLAVAAFVCLVLGALKTP